LWVAGSVQDLIEGQISNGGIGGAVSLPKGVFEIDDTLTIASVRGLRFSGESPWATELRWVGPADRPMFDIDRSTDILLEHFSITVGAGRELPAAAWIQNGKGRTGPKAAPGAQSSNVAWNNVRVTGDGKLINGFHVKLFDPAKDVKNDHHSFDHVIVTGYHGTAFILEGRNAKDLGLDRCQCLGLIERRQTGQYAVDTSTYPNQGGAFVWNKGSAIGHKQADFKIGDRNDTIRIDGVSSEKSARILHMPNYGPAADLACPVLLANYRFGTGDPNNPPARDGEVIRCEAEGPLSIVACRIGSAINRQQLRIYYAPDPPPGAFDFIGNAITNDGDGNIFSASPPTMDYRPVNLGYRERKWQPLGPSCCKPTDGGQAS
jgi:hypothetical protein